MFKKPPSLSNSTALKSSERRRLQNELSERFAIPLEEAKVLLPESVKQSKGTTTGGEHFTLFTSEDGPAAFRIGKGEQGPLVPTLYTIWKSQTACSLSTLVTNDMVMEKLAGGADLMLRGVLDRSIQALPDSLHEGSLVGVATTSRHYIRALGSLAAPVHTLKREDKGKAVEVIHIEGDALWSLGNKQEPPQNAAATATTPGLQDDGDENQPEASTSRLPTNAGVEQDGEKNGAVEPGDQQETAADVELSQADVDLILRDALLYAISQVIAKQPNLLPLSSSKFMDTYVLPSRWASSAGQEVNIKKSSFKNAGSFLKQAKKDGLINTKDAKSGETTVTGINLSHPEVKAFKPYKTIGDLQRQEKRKEAREEKESSRSAQRTVTLVELYKPHGATLALCSAMGYDKDTLVPPAEVRDSLQHYFTNESLINPHDPAFVNLDARLKEALLKKGEDLDFMPRSQAIERLVHGMQAWHKITVSEGGKMEELVNKGGVQKLTVAVKKRQGKKVVTVIEGVEAFQIPVQKLSEDLQVKCASSSTTNELPKSTAKKPLHEVVVQGNQTQLVQKELVETWGVPKSWIHVSK